MTKTSIVNELNDKMTNILNKDKAAAYSYYKIYVGDLPKKILNNGEVLIDAHNNDVDAYRHAYTSGMMTMRHGELSSDILGQAYEMKNEWDNYNVPEEQKATSEQMKNEKNMDLWNNRVGREIAARSKDTDDFAKNLAAALKQGALITNLHRDIRDFQAIPKDDYDFIISNAHASESRSQFTNPSSTGHYSFIRNKQENICGSLYCSTGKKKNWFDPYKLTGSFQSINKQNMPTDYFKNPILDSFISGKYSSFNSLQGNLFDPFTDWRGNYAPSQSLT